MDEEQCQQVPSRECSTQQQEQCRNVYETLTQEECTTQLVDKCAEEMSTVCDTLEESVCSTK